MYIVNCNYAQFGQSALAHSPNMSKKLNLFNIYIQDTALLARDDRASCIQV